MKKIKCKQCGKEFNSRFDKKRGGHILNRSRCFDCVPYKPGGTSLGGGTAKSVVWYNRQKAIFGIDPQLMRRKAHKDFIIKTAGGCCQLCGYNKTARNLTFHHVNPKEKENKLDSQQFNKSLPVILVELKKCVLLCHNCHGEVHDSMVEETVVKTKHEEIFSRLSKLEGKKWSDVMDHFEEYKAEHKKAYEEALKFAPETKIDGGIRLLNVVVPCEGCGKKLKRPAKDGNLKICRSCSARVNGGSSLDVIKTSPKPTKEELQKLLWEIPTIHIAKRYSVSDKAIERWVKNFELTKPEPGYWAKKQALEKRKLQT